MHSTAVCGRLPLNAEHLDIGKKLFINIRYSSAEYVLKCDSHRSVSRPEQQIVYYSCFVSNHIRFILITTYYILCWVIFGSKTDLLVPLPQELYCPADQLSRGWRLAIMLKQMLQMLFFSSNWCPFPCVYRNYNKTAIYTRCSVQLIKLAKYILPNWLPKYKTAVRK